jgi:hypothetical protein
MELVLLQISVFVSLVGKVQPVVKDNVPTVNMVFALLPKHVLVFMDIQALVAIYQLVILLAFMVLLQLQIPAHVMLVGLVPSVMFLIALLNVALMATV